MNSTDAIVSGEFLYHKNAYHKIHAQLSKWESTPFVPEILWNLLRMMWKGA